jgi:hypothetical protein
MFSLTRLNALRRHMQDLPLLENGVAGSDGTGYGHDKRSAED